MILLLNLNPVGVDWLTNIIIRGLLNHTLVLPSQGMSEDTFGCNN